MSLAGIRFMEPWAFLALALLPLYLYWAHFSRSPLERRRLAWVTLLRSLLLFLVVFALARPVLFRSAGERVAVLVEDLSESVGDRARLKARDFKEALASLENGPDRIVSVLAGVRAVRAEAGVEPPREGTDLEGALRLAGALVPARAAGEVILFSDGGADRGRPEREALLLASRGIPVHTVAVPRKPGPDAYPLSLEVPDPWYPGETREVRVLLEADRGGRGLLQAFLDGRPGAKKTVDLPGRGRFVFSLALRAGSPGGHLLEIRWSAPWDGVRGNDVLRVPLAVQDPPRVVWCRGGPGDPASLLEAAGFALERVRPGDLSRALASPVPPDLVVLDDAPAGAVGEKALAELARLVTFNGTGLLMAGATSSFGPGGYAGTPLEPLLPVFLEQREERRDPSVALVLIIDTSGSMGNRVDLAKEVARLAIRRLKPHDKVGIVEFYGHKRWAAPLQPASNQIEIMRALNRLQAGGGTVLLPAIEEAYYGLLDVTTRFKHVLILTDGGVERGPFESLVRRMAEAGITVSTVLVGPGRDSDFLLNLAQWGRGRYYQAPGRFDLPEIILKQPTSSLLPPFLPPPLQVRGKEGAPELKGIDLAQAPPLSGALETRARPGAEVLLELGKGVPLFARWPYGLGRTACWTTQTQGPMLGDWAAWKGYGPLFRSLLRTVVRRGGRPRLEVRMEREGDRVRVLARAVDSAGRPLFPGEMDVFEKGRRIGSGSEFAPGRFQALLPAASGAKAWRIRVRGKGGTILSAWAALPGKTFRAEEALGRLDEDVLASLRAPGGGLEDPSPREAARALTSAPGGRLPFLLSPWLLLLALFLYLFEVLFRRLPPPLPPGGSGRVYP